MPRSREVMQQTLCTPYHISRYLMQQLTRHPPRFLRGRVARARSATGGGTCCLQFEFGVDALLG
eukprot:5721928-Pyramimonas_sp.AAC.1